MKQSKPKTFTGLARSGSSKSARNSGIFSNSGSGQKRDSQIKASTGKQADLGVLRAACTVPAKKTSMPKTGKSAAEVAAYASHGEK